jgi:murein DD-endopeptidase MepM/ murein hydrolase activator NlpD
MDLRPLRPARTAGRVSAGLVLVLLATTLSQSALEARPHKLDHKQKIQVLRKRLKSLTQKKAEKRAELRETKRTQTRLADQLNQSYERLETAQEALRISEGRLKEAEAKVQEATERLQEAEERLAIQRRRFGKRIAASYREGSVSYLDVFLGSRNLSDFLDRHYYVTRMMGQDTEVLRSLRAAQEVVEQERRKLDARRSALAAAHEENAQRVARVGYEAAQRETLLQSVKKERALQEQELQELEEDSNGVQQSLEKELARRLASPHSFHNLPRWSGNLFMPARAPITSGFGYRFHPLLKYRRLHAGIDFGAKIGAPVYAAADGEVFFASWRGGYGRCIILLHGGSMSTLYGHLSRIDVRQGQSIHRGQVIGAVGSTGLSTGPHLHFEVRRNGVPVNPL